ncbi:MAG: anthranilate synthase component I family protein, partial [Candidatus Omnitrophica bacterium]|nr:anthranilate synthase component I family protein [Candidatus Omnitrophota bacterium]
STRPMKGTRPRGTTGRRDSLLRNQLLASSKDRAELTMIVDLERNDLGRVCKYDSIKVNKLRELEEYNTVFQTTATVSGSLHKNKDRIDLLRASFPGGSITGCPKLRAMEIIEELEPDRRCIYTGSLGYLSFSGNMDFNVLIRTILKRGNNLYFSVGGGIVADSQPEAEYRETLVKAKAMIGAING